VINYSSSNAATQTSLQKKALLQSDIDQMAETDDASVKNGEFIKFDSYNAVQASLVPANTADASAYLVAFLNNNHLYMIIGSGLTQAKFESFTNTFKLTS
jgi:hypothetical protein